MGLFDYLVTKAIFGGGGGGSTLINKTITENGTYNASSDGADGYRTVVANIPEATLGTKTITDNGTYNASSDNLDGFSSVTVDVDADLGTKSITANGSYQASADGYDGYSEVSVSVQPNVAAKSITENGTYNASDDSADGYSSVTVNVEAVLEIMGLSYESTTTVTVGANSVTNGRAALEYFCPEGKFVIASQQSTLTGTSNETSFVIGTTSAGMFIRWRNGEVQPTAAWAQYDALLIEGSVWEVSYYGLS